MKKRLLAMLLMTTCLSLFTGCNASKDPAESTEESSGEASTAESGSAENPVNVYLTDFVASDYVTLGDYKGLKISVPEVATYDETEYDLEAKKMYFQYIQETEGITDRAVALYDMTNIDYEGKKDGVAFAGGTAKGATLLIGSGQFIDGFEEGLIGVKPGETVDLNLKFPDGYDNEELAGQEVVFTVTVNFIPEMKDERIAELGITELKTVEDFRAYVKKQMDDQAQSDYAMTAGTAVMEMAVANAEFKEIPADLLEKNKDTYLKYLEQQAAMYGMDVAGFVSAFGGGLQLDSLVEDYCTRYTKESLVALAIAQEEGLIPSEEELDKRLEEYAANAGITVNDLFTNGTEKADYLESFLYEDVLNLLVDSAVNTPAN